MRLSGALTRTDSRLTRSTVSPSVRTVAMTALRWDSLGSAAASAAARLLPRGIELCASARSAPRSCGVNASSTRSDRAAALLVAGAAVAVAGRPMAAMRQRIRGAAMRVGRKTALLETGSRIWVFIVEPYTPNRESRENARVPLYRDEAIVLRTQKLGEADRIVTLLTRRHGRVRAVAKGVRRTASRFGARVEPFTQVDLLLHSAQVPGASSLDIVTQAETIEPYGERIAADYPRSTAGTAVLET